MLEIIYRIYKAIDDKDRLDYIKDNPYSILDNKVQIDMDCIICESRDHFKHLIKEQYSDDILFRRPKNAKTGDLYCTIIGEHCYNVERYFSKTVFKCDCCGAEVTTFSNDYIGLSNYDFERLGGKTKYIDKRFCSNECKHKYVDAEVLKLDPNDPDLVGWITPDSFQNANKNGYIYKITKRSTGEFYIGETVNAPVFRWGQHLKTERFPIENIEDYIFEVIHICSATENRFEVEKKYIQEYYAKDPKHSLNISCTANVVSTKQKLF